MRHLRTLAAATVLAATAFAAASPAEAAPFHVIRYADTGFCQVWDNGFTTHPWPVSYTVMSHRHWSYERTVAIKGYLLGKHYCNF